MLNMLAQTHPGKVRSHNEDAFLCEEQYAFSVLADGMGGHAAGEVASEITINTCKELAPRKESLISALVESHYRIVEHAEKHPESSGMGCAAVAAYYKRDELTVCWAGDSRAYLYNAEKGLQPISQDHSYVQWLLANGEITEEQARVHPDRNLVTQCLGLHPPKPDTNTVPWQVGDIVLLCSDGLTDEVDDDVIASIMASSDSLQERLDHLMKAALDAGGRDNITIVLTENVAKPSKRLMKLPVQSMPRWLPMAIGVGAAIAAVVTAVLFVK